jgi:hypothetical protein
MNASERQRTAANDSADNAGKAESADDAGGAPGTPRIGRAKNSARPTRCFGERCCRAGFEPGVRAAVEAPTNEHEPQ